MIAWLALVGLLAAPPEGPSPGALLAQADAALAQGDLAAAEATAEAIVAGWPTAARARLLLAEVARRRGDTAAWARWLGEVEAHGAAPLAAEARRRLAGSKSGSAGRIWAAGAVSGGHDSAVLAPGGVAPQPVAAWRALAWAEAGFEGRGGFGVAGGVDRSVYFGAPTAEDAERTGLTARLSHQRALAGGRLRLAAEGLVVFAGRTPGLHHGGGGLRVDWWGGGSGWWPFARAAGLGLAAPADRVGPQADWQGRAGAGIGFAGSAGRLLLEGFAQGAGPGAFAFGEGGLGVEWRRDFGPLRLATGVDGGLRFVDGTRAARPGAHGRASVALWGGLALFAQGAWVAALAPEGAAQQRRVFELGVEVRP